VIDLHPHYAMARLARGLAFQQSGRLTNALADLNRAVALAGEGGYYYRAALGHARAAAGQIQSAPAGDMRPFDRALLHLGSGARGLVLDCLEQAARESSSHLSYLMVDPMFDSLRRERRFLRLTRQLGLA